jgi:hypothetical protein
VAYHLPYAGKSTIDPHLIYPLEHFVVIRPKSIDFTPAQPGVYETKQPPNQPEAMAAIASNTKPGQKLSFNISGEGMLQAEEQDASAGASNGGANGAASNADSRPGGGLGAPIEAPDPLDKYRWYILSGFGVALVGGAFYIVNRARSVQVTGGASSGPTTPSAVHASSALPANGGPSGAFLQGLKEQLFQLELEHKQGEISDEEYAKSKAALDYTLARAVKRKG